MSFMKLILESLFVISLDSSISEIIEYSIRIIHQDLVSTLIP